MLNLFIVFRGPAAKRRFLGFYAEVSYLPVFFVVQEAMSSNFEATAGSPELTRLSHCMH